MTRQRLVKMTYGDRNILVKALQSARGSIGLEVFEKLQALMNKTLAAPKRKLYLSDEEHQYATLSLNGIFAIHEFMRSASVFLNFHELHIGIMFRLHLNIYTRNPTTRAALLGTSVTHSFFILPILQISHMPTSYPLISGVSTHILSPQKSDLFYFVTVVCFSFQLVKHLPKKR